MKDFQTLSLAEPAPSVVVVTIEREVSANTISAQLSRDLIGVCEHLASGDAFGAVVITGRGRFFCAGADLRDPERNDPGWLDLGRQALDAIADLPVATIAAINGTGVGGGTELALACDIRFAAQSAKLGLPEIKIGALPGAGGLSRLQHLVGPSKARDLLFTGRLISSDEALAIGLVDRVLPADEVLSAATAHASEIGQYATYAVRTAKRVLNESLGQPAGMALQNEYRQVDRMATPEQLAVEQRRAADRDPAYARIFGQATDGNSRGAA